MSLDYRHYYDLEAFLFEDVSQRFRATGSIGAFDFFSIVVWKANRAKSVMARRLLGQAAPGESLDALCHRLTAEVYRATDPNAHFFVLTGRPWNFALPMASAILAVLYPETFTVYDYRVCEELRAFEKLTNLTDLARLWSGYSQFIAAVQASSVVAHVWLLLFLTATERSWPQTNCGSIPPLLEPSKECREDYHTDEN